MSTMPSVLFSTASNILLRSIKGLNRDGPPLAGLPKDASYLKRSGLEDYPESAGCWTFTWKRASGLYMMFPKSSGLRFLSHSSSSSEFFWLRTSFSTKIGAFVLRATATASLGLESMGSSFFPSVMYIRA